MNNEEAKNLIHAIKYRMNKNDHSSFYYMLDKVNDRIFMYKSLFLEKKPKFMR
jgi:hypothetical protein